MQTSLLTKAILLNMFRNENYQGQICKKHAAPEKKATIRVYGWYVNVKNSVEKIEVSVSSQLI